MSGRIKIGFCAVVAFFAAYLVMLFHAPNDMDKIWLLYVARKWLQGQVLYRDLFESNPPLIIYIFSLPVRLANWLGITEWLALRLFTLALAGVSALLSLRVLGFHKGGINRPWLAVALLFVLVMLPDTVVTFGDREHIFATLVLPYLLLLLPGIERQRVPVALSLVIGLMAGIGFCIKPHCAVIWVAANVYYLGVVFSQKDCRGFIHSAVENFLRIENILIGACAALYILAVYLNHPDYIHTVLPMALEMYKYYGSPAEGKIIPFIQIFILVACALVSFRFSQKSAFSQDIKYILCLLLGAGVYILLNQGWYYTYYPLFLAVALLCVWGVLHHRARMALAENTDIQQNARRAGNECMAAIVLTALFYVTPSVIAFTYTMPENYKRALGLKDVLPAENPFGMAGSHQEDLKVIIDRYSSDKSYYSMNISFSDTVYLQLPEYSWPVRFNSLWMLRGLFGDAPDINAPYTDAEYNRENWVKTYVTQAIAEDMETKKPQLVVVDTSVKKTTFGNRIFDFLKLLNTDPAFVKAWSAYQLVERHDCKKAKLAENCSFDIYQRRKD